LDAHVQPQSELVRNLLATRLKFAVPDQQKRMALFECATGLDEHGNPDDDESDPLIQFRQFNIDKIDPYAVVTTPSKWGGALGGEALHDRIVRIMIKVCASAMMLYAARPEFIVPIRLPSRERKAFFGCPAHQHNTSVVKFPLSKRIANAPTKAGDGSQKRPHFRGWVLRTLRHERYKAKALALGLTHPRVILIEPTTIHPEWLNEIEDVTNTAMNVVGNLMHAGTAGTA
jgi:hypothetical protein